MVLLQTYTDNITEEYEYNYTVIKSHWKLKE